MHPHIVSWVFHPPASVGPQSLSSTTVSCIFYREAPQIELLFPTYSFAGDID